MNNTQLRKKWDKSKKFLEKQTECFGNVLADKGNMDPEVFDSYCEEMQGALEAEESLWKQAEGRLY